MAAEHDKKPSNAPALIVKEKEVNATLSGVFTEQTPLDIPVAAEGPANIALSETAAHSIAERLSASIAPLPADDFMPRPAAQPDTRHAIPCPPNTLPKIVETLPAQEFLAGIAWQQIKNLPGYAVSPLRKMGRDVFSSFDCFNALARQAPERDPLGEVLIASDLTHNITAINHLARLIEQQGVFIEKGSMDHSQFLPGYHPDVIIMMTQNWTFKLVRDRLENGAPVNLNSLYAWRGGLSHYEKKLKNSPAPQILPGPDR